jgi:lipoyl(octanoyl) transferase
MLTLNTRQLPKSPYQPIWQAMQQFTNERDEHTPDELWLLEHEPVFTQGQAGKAEHVLNPHDIPIVQTDRGGQVTYHGPGQLMGYTLLDIKRLGLGTRDFVIKLEQVIIELLKTYHIQATGKRDAPGVYVADAKICSIGLRVRRGRSYHGIALNVDMDLTPFRYINPCGFSNLPMTQIKDFVPNITLPEVIERFNTIFCEVFAYNPSVCSTNIDVVL